MQPGRVSDSGASSPPLGHSTTACLQSTPSLLSTAKKNLRKAQIRTSRSSPMSKRRVRDISVDNGAPPTVSLRSQSSSDSGRASLPPASPQSPSGRRVLLLDTSAKAKSREAQRVNDSMVYLDGPQVYTCAQCRTHLTSHDDIVSKSFHGRHGRAYLFDQCVNVSIGPSDDRRLITGLHTVCDIFCKRCKTLIGWTYLKAYDPSQKYKEGKFIIEKVNLHLEESDYYDVSPPAGERSDRWRRRSMSWGDSGSLSDAMPSNGASIPGADGASSIVFEYRPNIP